MRIKFQHLSLALATLLCVGAAHAQPAPNPMDIVPEKMPFDVPYGAPVSLDQADSALSAAVGEAKRRDWKMVCAVVDSGGTLVSFKRMDGAQIASVDIAAHKAKAAAQFRRETKAFETGIQAGFNYLITLDGVIGSRGGIPMVSGGKIIGAIGCSGGTGSQDEVVSRAGIATVR